MAFKKWLFSENGFQITRKEIKYFVTATAIGLGTWLIIAPIREWIINSAGNIGAFALGLGIILIGLAVGTYGKD